MGELHVVFCALKTIGKCIDGSGLDACLVQSGIYGPTTVEQVKSGKHVYRSFEGFMTIYLALFQVYLDKLISEDPLIESDLRRGIINAITSLEGFRTMDKLDIQNNHDQIISLLKSIDFISIQSIFDKKLTNTAKFLRNFMKIFEILLVFIRATRQQNWSLHLQSLHELSKYFYAYDMQNYARYTPIYLSQMFALNHHDVETWCFLESGNFSVNKSGIPFTAIGCDYAIEHENRSYKVMGGIKGLANKDIALEQYFLVGPVMNNIIEEFCETFNIDNFSSKRDEHHEISGSKNERIDENLKKLGAVFRQHSVNFDESSCLFNVLTKKVMEPSLAQRFLSHDEEGEQLLDQFIENRFIGDIPIDATMRKNKLPTFTSNSKTITVKIKDKLVKVREEHKLMSRFLVVSRTRPEINLPHYLGEYEFSVVPRSIFSSDGLLHKSTDKAELLDFIQNLIPPVEEGPEIFDAVRKVLLIDGMAIAHKVNIKKSNIKLCEHYADKYTNIVLSECRGYAEVRVIFYRYIKSSLKSKTRDSRTNGVQIQYKVADDTQISALDTHQFLSHIDTKHELTIYLANKLKLALDETEINYVIVYDTTCETNIPNLDRSKLSHSHEEADTLLVLHCLDVAKRNPFQETYVLCSDTDVLLLLLSYYEELCAKTVFKGNDSRDIDIGKAFESLGPDKVKALLGFHAFSGCDQTGKFAGYGKPSYWTTLMSSPSSVIKAFERLGDDFFVYEDDSTLHEIERFVLDLYQPRRPNNVDSLSALRWYMFSKKQLESEKLPPTRSALKHVIGRCHCVVRIWKQSHVTHPLIPDLQNNG